MLGVGFTGLVRFCGLMDPSRFLTRKPYDRIVESIQQIALAIVQLSMMKMALAANDGTYQSLRYHTPVSASLCVLKETAKNSAKEGPKGPSVVLSGNEFS
uniref:Uncharacterized protein n=1 Tax=Vespula pensylvanica TaxID=30213 RepID=A0A834NWP1_VESPE|nr:hypothetical protein H0235_010104 [Vespula pensylvanica]